MRIIRAKDYQDMSRRAADVLAAQVILKPDCVLGLATGSTPIGAYKELIARCACGELDFSGVGTVNLDEYQGLAPDHPQSYRRFMRENLFDHINIDAANTHVPDGLAADPAKECARYEALIDAMGGVDMQLLGLGHNGHVGFNEPADAFVRDTNLIALTQSTIEANKRFFEREADVPRHAFTMGMGAIMKARRVLLIVSGAEKAKILREVLCGPITPRVPGSVLQLHPDVTVVADEAALADMDAIARLYQDAVAGMGA